MNIQEGISKVVSNQDLQKQEMSSVMFEILEGKATDAQIGAFLIALSIKGETVEEVIGAVEVMRELSTKVKTDLSLEPKSPEPNVFCYSYFGSDSG